MVKAAAAERDEIAPVGHNSTIAAAELLMLIERVERLEEEKKGIGDDIKDVYAEAKARGFCPKMMKRMIKLRKLEGHVRREQEALRESYMIALGLDFGDTPLGQAAGMGRPASRMSVAALALRLQAMGATISVGRGKQTIVIPTKMATAEIELPDEAPAGEEAPIPWNERPPPTVRDPSDGSLVTLKD